MGCNVLYICFADGADVVLFQRRLDYLKKFAEKNKREQRIEEREKDLYFLKQKVLGVFVLIFTAISIWLLDGDATVGVVMIPLGIALIFSKKTIIYGKYYWKMEDEST